MRMQRTASGIWDILKQVQKQSQAGEVNWWHALVARQVSNASESSLVWPPPEGVESVRWSAVSADPRAGRNQAGQSLDGEVKKLSREETLALLAACRSSGKTVAKKHIRSLRAYELREILQKWGYDTLGLKKEELVSSMHTAIVEDDILGEAAAGGSTAGLSLSGVEDGQAYGDDGKSQHAPKTVLASDHGQAAQVEGGQLFSTLEPTQVAEWLSEARTEDVQVLDVRDVCGFADHMVLASGRSNQHVHAAASGLCWQIGQKVENYQRPNALYREGDEDSDWVAIDTGKIVVHVMTKEAREQYDLEGLWKPGRGFSVGEDVSHHEQETMLGW